MTVLKYENRKSAFTFTHYTSLKLAANFSSSIIVVYCSLLSELSYQLHIIFFFFFFLFIFFCIGVLQSISRLQNYITTTYFSTNITTSLQQDRYIHVLYRCVARKIFNSQ